MNFQAFCVLSFPYNLTLRNVVGVVLKKKVLLHYLLTVLDFNVLQMMSMGCGMLPMMFPQHYMPTMGMGIGMGMVMDMGLSRPMMPFHNVMAGSGLPTPAASAHLDPRFPMPAFHMSPQVPVPDPSRIQPNNQSDAMLNPLGMQNPNQPRIPSFADPYQQYMGLHQMQLHPPQVMSYHVKPFVFMLIIKCMITSFLKILKNTHIHSFSELFLALSLFTLDNILKEGWLRNLQI